MSLVCANDANAAGVGEAAHARSKQKGSMLMLAPGSGLGASYINAKVC
jgi:glucokinase